MCVWRGSLVGFLSFGNLQVCSEDPYSDRTVVFEEQPAVLVSVLTAAIAGNTQHKQQQSIKL